MAGIIELISFDIGISNPGISIFTIFNNSINIFSLKDNWSTWKTEKTNILKKYSSLKKFDYVIIEDQICGNKTSLMNFSMANFIDGYFSSLGSKVIILPPITKGLKLKTRKERKDYSVDKLNSLFETTSFNFKSHDICDSILLGLNFIKNKNISLENIKLKVLTKNNTFTFETKKSK